MDAARFQEPRRRMIPIRSPAGDGEMAVLDFGDADRPVDVVFLHANGFNAATYRAVLAPLSASLRLVAPDLRGHGSTRLAADPRGRRTWHDLRDDALALLEALGGPAPVLAGHSMGATVSLLAAAAKPEAVRGLVLFDPVILPPLASWLARLPGAYELALSRTPLAQGALRRRPIHASRSAAFQSYRGRGVFAGWPETALADYVAAGFVDRDDGQVELACDPAWESSNYAAQGHDVWAALNHIDAPVRLLRATQGSASLIGDAERLHRRRPNITVDTVAGGHLFPVTHAETVREALLDAVA